MVRDYIVRLIDKVGRFGQNRAGFWKGRPMSGKFAVSLDRTALAAAAKRRARVQDTATKTTKTTTV